MIPKVSVYHVYTVVSEDKTERYHSKTISCQNIKVSVLYKKFWYSFIKDCFIKFLSYTIVQFLKTPNVLYFWKHGWCGAHIVSCMWFPAWDLLVGGPASLVLLVNIIMLVNGICAVFSAGFWMRFFPENPRNHTQNSICNTHHQVLWAQMYKCVCVCASSSPREIYKTTASFSLFFHLPTDSSHPLCRVPALF